MLSAAKHLAIDSMIFFTTLRFNQNDRASVVSFPASSLRPEFL